MKKKMVLPGEFLSTEEEFEPGQNAFYSEGNIYSGRLGEVSADAKNKQISVKPAVKLNPIRPGSIVFGIVMLVKENSVSITLCQNPDAERQVIAPTSAMLPIRNVSQDYVENLRDHFKIGDIVKAKVSKILPGGNIDLATDQPDLGVIKAFCGKCRHSLYVFGTSLRCMNCGSNEKRKMAKGYLVK